MSSGSFWSNGEASWWLSLSSLSSSPPWTTASGRSPAAAAAATRGAGIRTPVERRGLGEPPAAEPPAAALKLCTSFFSTRTRSGNFCSSRWPAGSASPEEEEEAEEEEEDPVITLELVRGAMPRPNRVVVVARPRLHAARI